jgi:hypothetical protein
MQPIPIPREVTRVDGCNCTAGGGKFHVTGCSIFDMPEADRERAVEQAEARVAAFAARLNARPVQAAPPSLTQESVDMVWVFMAERDGNMMFGKPFRARIEWPEGPPHGYTAESFRDLARAEVAKRRDRRS